LSFIVIPLYKPMDMNKKKEMDKIVVDNNEFSNMDLSCSNPKNQTDIIVKGRTIRVIIKRFLELTIL